MDASRISSLPHRIAAQAAGQALIIFARFITAAQAVWVGSDPVPRQRIYFANHTSNGDFVLVWAVLPAAVRERTRPVAASDYWLKSKLRAFIGRDVFKAVLIDRQSKTRTEDPVALMVAALDEGSSLIIFPEGKRNMDDEVPLLPFKTGLYHVAKTRPHVDLVPVHIHNLNKVMPKGEVIPVPLTVTVTFGAPIHLGPDEPKAEFLTRASQALLALFPK
ncbi:MAG: lysophospholipid acyltransferase family protein [Deltaproteobacteria bacterium]